MLGSNQEPSEALCAVSGTSTADTKRRRAGDTEIAADADFIQKIKDDAKEEFLQRLVDEGHPSTIDGRSPYIIRNRQGDQGYT